MSYNIYILSAPLHAGHYTGAQTEAESLIAQAEVEAESIWEKKYRVIVLSDLAQFMLQAKEREAAHKVMQKATQWRIYEILQDVDGWWSNQK